MQSDDKINKRLIILNSKPFCGLEYLTEDMIKCTNSQIISSTNLNQGYSKNELIDKIIEIIPKDNLMESKL